MTPYREAAAMEPVDPDVELARRTLEPDLLENENLLWAHRPRRGLVFTRSDVWITIFMLFWTGFACFWTIGALFSGAGLMSVFGLPFVFIGFYILVGRYFVDAKKRERTFYGITDRRVLIVSLGPPRVFSEVPLARIPQTSVEEGARGFGDIYLDSPTYIDGRGRQKYATPAMPQVPNAAEVHRLLRETMDADQKDRKR